MSEFKFNYDFLKKNATAGSWRRGYEVYQKELTGVFEGITDYKEWVIIHYTGGGKAPKITTGNSNAANFIVVGSMLHGGCYEQVSMYQEQEDLGYKRVDL